ncbi:MAG: Rieske 2Fe-2S domain-containing protein [Defluviicoccus sp.]|nr:Rieske 2Fe-2S domain-containing protein [Defluviicoccus sp.]MDE0386092.1 Rieske 2Fe-2S domain-containing protein [Defluviicoccus sp.]
MLSAEQNDRLTRTGPGTEMGAVMRRYWQPFALVEELPDERPVKEVRVLGEDLVVLRDDRGRYGALARRCAHRAGDLAYGRCEDGGLRCPYHGWLYAVDGRCLEQPAEPAGSTYHERVRQPAFPCVERNGIVYGYMGGGEAPPLPGFDWFDAPASHCFAFKALQRANWLQAVEGEIDPAHLSYLHRYLDDDAEGDGSYGFSQFLAATDESDVSVTAILREVTNPRLEIARTDFGVRIFALRDRGDVTYVRVTNYLFPHTAVVSVGDWTLVQVHVPIDDASNWRYDVFYDFRAPIDRETLREEKLKTYEVPGYTPKRNRENRYGFSAAEQRAGTYAGVGYDFNIHDTMILEGQGAIQDRSRENLAYTDMAIVAARRMLSEALDGAIPLPMAERAETRYDHLVSIDTIAPTGAWRRAWVAKQIERRAQSVWAGGIAPARLEALLGS